MDDGTSLLLLDTGDVRGIEDLRILDQGNSFRSLPSPQDACSSTGVEIREYASQSEALISVRTNVSFAGGVVPVTSTR